LTFDETRSLDHIPGYIKLIEPIFQQLRAAGYHNVTFKSSDPLQHDFTDLVAKADKEIEEALVSSS
jgi:hypothetical protein